MDGRVKPAHGGRFLRRQWHAYLGAFALALTTPALGEDITAAVPGHHNLTYESLLKLAMPDMTKNADGGWDSGPLRNLRGLDDKPAQPVMAEAHGPNALVAARASGFVLQSADTRPFEIKPVSYLDSQ